jgi:tetratricopeptide (TPR) repeat protein
MYSYSGVAKFPAGIHSRKRRARAIVAGALVSCAALMGVSTTQAVESEETNKRFHIAYTEGSIGSSLIAAGKFSEAIDKIQAGLMLSHELERYERYTNLCVAHISRQDYVSAEQHCKAAVRRSSSHSGSMMRYQQGRQDSKRMQSLAWNNLGVLQALQGEQPDARKSFAKAQKRGLKSSVLVSDNLASLEQRTISTDLANAVTVSPVSR